MAIPLKHQVVAKLEIVSLPPDPLPDATIAVLCPKCSSALDLHQPDPEWPEQMLGVCLGCKIWYVMRSESRFGTTLVRLPSVDSIQDSWLSRDGHG